MLEDKERKAEQKRRLDLKNGLQNEFDDLKTGPSRNSVIANMAKLRKDIRHRMKYESSAIIVSNTHMKRNEVNLKMFDQNLNKRKVLKKTLRHANSLKRLNGGNDPFLNNTR